MVDTLEWECCVEDALRMEAWKRCRMQACAEEARGQLPIQMAKGVIVRRLSLLWQMSHPPLCLVEYLVVAPFMPQLVAYFKACLSHQS
jgi:hypothetical protein